MATPEEQVSPPTILLVDDEESLLRVIALGLEEYGYRVITAVDGVEAWNLLQAGVENIQAIITDVAMPNMDGVELAERVRTLPSAPPLIFISGYSRGNTPVDHPFLPKPFSTDQLVALLVSIASRTEPALDN